MKQTRNGGLLIKVRGDPNQVEVVKAEVARTTGSEVNGRFFQQRKLVEVRDLDEWTHKTEVINAITAFSDIGLDFIIVVNFRSQYGRTQAALVFVTSTTAHSLVNSRRLKVGMVSCRIRLHKQKMKCYRSFTGHLYKECKGPDRSTSCRRCGMGDHFAKDSRANKADCKEFARIIEA